MTKTVWRAMWFQLHQWIGLSLAIFIIPLSLSGAALVWHEPLDRALNPARYAVSGTGVLVPDAYVAAAAAVLKPGERIAVLTMPEDRGPVVIGAVGDAKPGRAGPPPRTMVYLDPPTARVLDVASSNAGVMRFIHVLHGSLQVPGVGRTIVGWIGVATLVSSFTGLWLWWPSVGSWVRGLKWRRRGDFDNNLHHRVGFWIALPLFILSLTGAWIAFPAFFGAITGSQPKEHGPDRAALARARPLASPARSLADVLTIGGSSAPNGSRSD